MNSFPSPSLSNSSLLENSNSVPSTPLTIPINLSNPKPPSVSLWQQCRIQRDRLKRVPNFFQLFLKPIIENPEEYLASPLGNNLAYDHILGSQNPHAPSSSVTNLSNDPALKSQYAQFIPNDPVAQVILCLRMGSSWSFLFNALGQGDPVKVDPECLSLNIRVCQKSTAFFLMACKKYWDWGDKELFTVSQLYNQNTNDTVKVSFFPFRTYDPSESRTHYSLPALQNLPT
jgi:cell division control protein 24